MLPRLKDFLKHLNLVRPRPFLFIQRKLNIHHDWKEVKEIAARYRYQLIFMATLSSIPFAKPFLLNLQLSLSHLLSSVIQEDEVNYLNENFVKKVVEGVLRSSQVRREAGLFVENLGKEEVLERAVCQLFIRCLHDKDFEADLLQFAKSLVKDILHDPLMEKDLRLLVLKSFRDKDIQLELKDMFIWILQQEDTRVALGEALKAALKSDHMRKAVFSILTVAFNEVMLDKNTSEKMRKFVFDLLENEGGQEGSVKKALDYFIERTFTWRKQHAAGRLKIDQDLFVKPNEAPFSAAAKEFEFF